MNGIEDSSRRSYSQSGEDLIVNFIFNAVGIAKPHYIDIGAYHPSMFSNTALFYHQGCRGVNIEANPHLVDEFLKQRKEDVNLNIGVGIENNIVDFYVISTPTLSTFKADEAQNYVRNGNYTITEVIPIQVKTINHIIDYYANGHFPEFLSLDTEGFDLEILQSINYKRSSPIVICVETISFSETGEGVKNQAIINFLKTQGYLLYADTFINTIFVKESVWKQQGVLSNKITFPVIEFKQEESPWMGLRVEIESLKIQLKESKEQVEAMKSSKFWKLRTLWFKLKNLLKISHPEPSQLALPLTSKFSSVEPISGVLAAEPSTSEVMSKNADSVNIVPDNLDMGTLETPVIIEEELLEPSEPPPPLLIGTLNEQTRNEWIEQVLLQLPAGLRLLDAGCGEQQYKKFCEHLVYVGQDFGQYDGQGNNQGLQTGNWDNSNLDIISDITAIPEPDQSFDVILCTEVFEHIPDPLAAIKEFSRLLRSGGKLILTAPFCSLTHFAPYHFHSGFNSYFYEFNLPKYGLNITSMERNGNFFEYLAQEARRIPFAAQSYSNSSLEDRDYHLIDELLVLLDKLNQTNSNSEELLCFGYHIIALKD